MTKSIKLVAHKIPPPTEPVGVVRITPEAESVARSIQRDTGMTARHIVSQIITQAEGRGLIEYGEEG